MTWFGWGTGNFLSWMLMFPLPVLLVMFFVMWIQRGMPSPVVAQSTLALLIGGLVVATWNLAALAANHYNRVVITNDAVVIAQGFVPWPVCFRRRRVPIADAHAFEVDDVYVVDNDADRTQYRVRLRRDGGFVLVSGWMLSPHKARRIAAELDKAVNLPTKGRD